MLKSLNLVFGWALRGIRGYDNPDLQEFRSLQFREKISIEYEAENEVSHDALEFVLKESRFEKSGDGELRVTRRPNSENYSIVFRESYKEYREKLERLGADRLLINSDEAKKRIEKMSGMLSVCVEALTSPETINKLKSVQALEPRTAESFVESIIRTVEWTGATPGFGGCLSDDGVFSWRPDGVIGGRTCP